MLFTKKRHYISNFIPNCEYFILYTRTMRFNQRLKLMDGLREAGIILLEYFYVIQSHSFQINVIKIKINALFPF